MENVCNSMQTHWIIESTETGLTISELLRKKNISARRRRIWRREAKVFLNQQEVPWYTRMNAGDHVCIKMKETGHFEPWAFPLDCIFEDVDYLAINKPSGMLVHPTVKERNHTLLNAAQAYLDQTSPGTSPHPVHRLDKGTSGLILLAKSGRAHYDWERLAMAQSSRRYLALVHGTFMDPYADIAFPIARKKGSIIEREVSISKGQFARTFITCIARSRQASLLSLILATGRTHQIRVHCAHLGFPLLGDELYGGHREFIKRPALHAVNLQFRQPQTGQMIHLQAPPPEDFKAVCNILFPSLGFN